MKEYLYKWWKEYFSFTQKEQRGMLALASILFLLVLANAYYEPSPLPIEIHHLTESKPPAEEAETVKNYTGTINPNHAGFSELVAVGFPKRVAGMLIKYRNAGAQFKSAADLKKLYGMNDSLFQEIRPRISIPVTKPLNSNIETTITTVTPKQVKRRYKPQSFQLNAVDSLELVKVSGIGPKTAHRVLRYRNWLGGFTDTSQLREIWGLYPDQQVLLLKLGRIDEKKIKKININTAAKDVLVGHPYIRYKAKVVIAYRIEHGPFANADELKLTGVYSDSLIQKLRPYLKF